MTVNSVNYDQITTAIKHFVSENMQVHQDLAMTDKITWMSMVSPGKTLDQLLDDNVVGFQNESILEAKNLWNSIPPGGHSVWNDAATALNTPFTCLDQLAPGGVCSDEKSPGYVFFVYAHALCRAGLTQSYHTTPPAYS